MSPVPPLEKARTVCSAISPQRVQADERSPWARRPWWHQPVPSLWSSGCSEGPRCEACFAQGQAANGRPCPRAASELAAPQPRGPFLPLGLSPSLGGLWLRTAGSLLASLVWTVAGRSKGCGVGPWDFGAMCYHCTPLRCGLLQSHTHSLLRAGGLLLWTESSSM